MSAGLRAKLTIGMPLWGQCAALRQGSLETVPVPLPEPVVSVSTCGAVAQRCGGAGVSGCFNEVPIRRAGGCHGLSGLAHQGGARNALLVCGFVCAELRAQLEVHDFKKVVHPRQPLGAGCCCVVCDGGRE